MNYLTGEHERDENTVSLTAEPVYRRSCEASTFIR